MHNGKQPLTIAAKSAISVLCGQRKIVRIVQM